MSIDIGLLHSKVRMPTCVWDRHYSPLFNGWVEEKKQKGSERKGGIFQLVRKIQTHSYMFSPLNYKTTYIEPPLFP